MINHSKYNKLAKRIKENYPKSEIKYKDEHWFWKLLPSRLRTSGTTFRNTIWMPTRDNNFEMLAHEYQHLVDWNDLGTIGFLTTYCCPQILSLFWFFFAILALAFGLYPFALIFGITGFLFLLPWPSKGRAYLEMKGYLMTIYVLSASNQYTSWNRNFIVDALRGWLYYKMVWTRWRASNLVLDAESVLNEKEAIADISIAFRDVYEILTK